MTKTKKTMAIAILIYSGLNVILSSAQYFFKVFSDGWMETIFTADLIIPAILMIIYWLFFSKKKA